MKNQNNNGCGCHNHPAPAPSQPADISMNVCDRNANVLPMLQTYTTKVLKPNVCCKKNILTQQMMSCEGYKYVIKWDFDLNGQTITVPKNCILEFDGGSLKNGTIIGQDTLVINVGDVDIWGENLTREGTWREKEAEGNPPHLKAFKSFGTNLSVLSGRLGTVVEGIQSMAMTETHNFLIAHYFENYREENQIDRAVVFVYDKDWTYKGHSSISGVYSHGNSATICDNKIYLASAFISGCSVIDIPTLLANCVTGTPTTPEANLLSEMGNMTCISYSDENETFCAYYGDGFIGFRLFNKSYEEVGRCPFDISGCFQEVTGLGSTLQGIIYKDGIVSAYAAASTARVDQTNAIVRIDINLETGEVVGSDIIPLTPNTEVECIFTDPVTNKVFAPANNFEHASNDHGQPNPIFVYYLSDDYYTGDPLARKNLGLDGDANASRISVYIKKGFDGKSDGTLANPFKHFWEAYFATLGYNAVEFIFIYGEDSLGNPLEYYVGAFPIVNKNCYYKFNSHGNSAVIVNGTYLFTGPGTLELRNITVKSDNQRRIIQANNASVFVYGVRFLSNVSHAIHMEVNNCDVTIGNSKFIGYDVEGYEIPNRKLIAAGSIPIPSYSDDNIAIAVDASKIRFVSNGRVFGHVGCSNMTFIRSVDGGTRKCDAKSLELSTFKTTDGIALDNVTFAYGLDTPIEFISVFGSESAELINLAETVLDNSVIVNTLKDVESSPLSIKINPDDTHETPLWRSHFYKAGRYLSTGSKYLINLSELAVRPVIAAFGDSLVAAIRNNGKGFLRYITSHYTSYAVSGASIGGTGDISKDDDTIVKQIDKYVMPEVNNIDIVLTNGGYNDYLYNNPLGEMPTHPITIDEEDSALNKVTVYGALQHIFYQMIKKFPNSRRIFVGTHRINSAPWTDNNVVQPDESYNLTELMDGIKQVCKLYGVYYVDIFNESLIVTSFGSYKAPGSWGAQDDETKELWNRTYCTDYDGVHPLDLGYRIGYVPLVQDAVTKCMGII